MTIGGKQKYRADRHGTFEEEWLPHKRVYDCWRCSGFLHDFYNSGNLFAYHINLHKLVRLSNEYYMLFIECEDINEGKNYQRQFILEQNKNNVDIDADSIFCGEIAQLLVEKEAMALRVFDTQFSFEICLLKNKGAFWRGESGLVHPEVNNNKEQLFSYFYPQMTTYGRINLGGKSVRVKGKSLFERVWGNIALKKIQRHWETIHLLLNNNEELNIINFPHCKINNSALINNNDALSFPDTDISPLECFDCEGYNFVKSWQVKYNGNIFALQPLTKESSNLPFNDMALQVQDEYGNIKGYALSCSWVGARAKEPGNIDLSSFGASNRT